MIITPAQVRAARAMLQISRQDLSKGAKVAERTISDFETGRRNPIPATLTAIKTALEVAGVIFIEENGDGPGVRLKRREIDGA